MTGDKTGRGRGSTRPLGERQLRPRGRPDERRAGRPRTQPERPAKAPPPEPAGLGARRLAARLIEAVLGQHRALDDALDGLGHDASLAALEPRDRGFGRLIAATVLRRAGSLDTVLGRFIERPLPQTASRAKSILLSAAAQILLIGTPAHAAINLAVEQCRRDGAARRYDKLANAVLRRVAADGPAILRDLAIEKLDVPAWMLKRWSSAYGEDRAREIAIASLAEAPLDLSVKVPSEASSWAAKLGGRVLTSGTVRLGDHGRIEDLEGFAEGAWWVQDAAAALPARLLGLVAGREIADLCAAPGGKTAALAAAGAHVVAVDASGARLERLKANVARLGLGERVEVVEADAATWEPGRRFDGVLLDAPCTATGTIRRHPDILHLKRETDAARLASLQRQLIEQAARLVKPGGRLVYCVCSLEPEEGPGGVEAFLAGAMGRDFVRMPVQAEEVGGAPEWIVAPGDLRTLPYHSPDGVDGSGAVAPAAASGMDGFYAARLVRRAG
ncbi:MAG: transcription antitermination factor NusB [Hyphomicrobiaceae bacterium]|nr:transcription antitermination factor NusB [Hyphomicrobiaceae bacterium]